jgi:hypothetical protein
MVHHQHHVNLAPQRKGTSGSSDIHTFRHGSSLERLQNGSGIGICPCQTSLQAKEGSTCNRLHTVHLQVVGKPRFEGHVFWH